MSSDQQLNIHISVVNDSCRTNDNQRDCDNPFECSVVNYTSTENTIDDITAANLLLENEKTTNLGSESNIADKEDGKEIHECDNHSSGENFQSDQQLKPLSEENHNDFERIVNLDDKCRFEEINNEVCHNGQEKSVDSSNSHNCERNNLDEALSKPTISEQIVTFDSQSDVLPPTSNHSNDQSCNHFSTQQQNCAELLENNDEGTKRSKENETADEAEASNEEQTNTTVNSSVIGESKEQIEENNVCDDEEIGKSDEASNDENELTSNELDSNEDSSEFPDIVDFDGTNEVENDEYILDTFVRKPRKERRRIVSMNDDSDLEIEVERERLLQSPLLEIEDVEEEIEQLIRNEKPGPKSKKMSTQKLKEFQARALLRNAVVIPSSRGKKKKSRIIDSDEDDGDNSLLPYCVDVDDIGLPDLNEDNDNETDGLVASSILLNDVEEADAFPIEQLKQDENGEEQTICEISLDENISQNKSSTEECPTDSMIGFKNQEFCTTTSEPFESLQNVQQHESEPSNSVSVGEKAIMRDSENSTDSTNQQSGIEQDIEVRNVDLPPFPSSSSSEDEDEFIPNDVYFGTPDNSKKGTRGKGRPRVRPGQSSPRGIAAYQNVAQPVARGRGTGRRGRPPGREQFIDNRQISSTSTSSSSSESEDEYQKSKARRKPQTITIVKAPSQLYQRNSLPTTPIQKPQPIQRQSHRKRDRFYDKSQDIPNDIYFGDVGDVPLHVLYSYGASDSDNDAKTNSNVKSVESTRGSAIRFSSQVSRGRGRTVALSNSYGQKHNDVKHQTITPPYIHNHKSRGRPKINAVSPSNDRSIQMMKTYLKAAGLRKVKLNRLWEGCKSNSERAAKMLELLREKGLEGEPTISKCKQLKVDYLTKKEIEDLDPNLIIQTEGRTRRSVTRAATKRKYTYDEDEILETRTKLRKVIDSDSDFD